MDLASQAAGIGALAFSDVPALQRPPRLYEPCPRARARYDDSYATFLEVRRRLAPLYRRLNPNQGARP